MSKLSVFTRDATGLVRQMSVRDALWYTILSQGLIGSTNLFLHLSGPASFPGGDLALAWVLGIPICVPMAVTYAMLTSAMPRSGGDYMYQSRILHPAVGFAVVLGGAVIFMGSFFPWVVWALNEGMAPFFTALGVYSGNQSLTNFGNFLPGTQGILLIGLICTGLALWNLLYGLKPYIRLQNVIFISAVVFTVLLGVFAATNSANFPTAYNAFMLHFQNLSTDLYHYTISNAQQAGFNTNPPFSWASSLALVPITFTASYGYMWATYNAGEIKRASMLKNDMIIVVGGVVIYGVWVALITYFTRMLVGYQFENAMSYQYTAGTAVGTLPLASSSFLLWMSVMSNSVIVLCVLLFAFAIQQFQYFFSLAIPQVRVLFAMSFDRLFPDKFTAISEKYHSPWLITGFVGVMGILWILLWLFVSVIATYFTVMMITTTLVMSLTQICGIMFPYRRKDMFESSPCGKYKIAGVPAITIAGILGLISSLILEYYYVTVPVYGGYSNPAVIILNVTLILGCGIYYYLARWYRKRQGIDLNLAFKVVPPE